MSQRPTVLVGAVSYLNARPLVYGLERRYPRIRLVFDLPSRLADRLAGGGLDVALIPSIELGRNPGFSVLSDACIACRGPALSVKLFSRAPIDRIRTLALDEGSRTSAALVRILLKERFNLEPELEPFPVGKALADCHADATLLIGDRAIGVPQAMYRAVWDLGDAWYRWVQLPFVFAMWVARAGGDHGGLDEALSAARDQGVAEVDRIAATDGPGVGMSAAECVAYLRDNLHYFLGPQERQGLEMFYRLSAKHGIVPHETIDTFFAPSADGNPTDVPDDLSGRSTCGVP